jgi:hypothetical protein
MLISVFKRNLFINSLLLLPIAMLVRVTSLMFPDKTESINSGGILYQVILKYLPESPVYKPLIGVFMVFLTAVIINRMMIKNRIANDITLLPGLFYILLSSIVPELFVFSPILFASFFLIQAFSNLFKTYKKYNSERFLFNTGFYFGVSILFCNSFILFLVPILIGFVSIRSYNLREFLQLLSGLSLIAYFYTFYLIFSGQSYEFESFTFNNVFKIINESFSMIILNIVTGSLIFISLFTYSTFIKKKSIQSQKKVNILFWFVLSSLIAFMFFNPVYRYSYFLTLAFGLSYFTSAIFLKIKNKMISEIVYVIIVFLILIYQFQYYI